MMRCRRWPAAVGVALATAFVLAAPAGGQVAEDGDVVLIAPTAGAPGLAVAPDDDHAGQTCVRALLPVVPGDAGVSAALLQSTGEVGGSADCGDPLRSDGDALLLADAERLGSPPTGPAGAVVLAGLVPAGAARVVLRTRAGTTRVVPTAPLPDVPGPLAGRVAGFVVLATDDERRHLVEARVERADGSALGVATRLGSSRDELGGVVTGPPEIASVPTSAGRLAVQRSFESILEPTAAALERRITGTCTSITLGGRPLQPLTRCADETSVPSLPASAAICRADRVVLSGVLPPGRTSGLASLADGRRVPVAVTAREALPGRRGWSLVAPRGVGVRRLLDLPDTAGSGVGLPPATAHCALEAGGEQQTEIVPTSADLLRFGRARQAVAAGVPARLATAPGGVPLLALDGPAGVLCLGLGAAPQAADCAVVGRDPAASPLQVVRQAPGERLLVAGVTNAATTQVRVRTAPHGAVRIVTTAPTGTYAGAYAGRLRTYAAVLPRGAFPVEVRATVPAPPPQDDPATLGYLVSASDEHPPRVRRLAALPGSLHVDATLEGGSACAAVTEGRPAPGHLDCASVSGEEETVLDVQAPCRAKRMVLTAQLAGRAARLRVVDHRGGVHVGRRVALGGGKVLHVVVLPRGIAPRAVAVTGASGPDLRRRRLPIPAATEQCGWSDHASRTAPPTDPPDLRPDISQSR